MGSVGGWNCPAGETAAATDHSYISSSATKRARTVTKVAGLVDPLEVDRGRRRHEAVGGDLAAAYGEGRWVGNEQRSLEVQAKTIMG